MCFFLTIGVPARHVNEVPAIFGRGFMVGRTANSRVLKAMPEGFETCLILSGMCSCCLYRSPPDGDVLENSDTGPQQTFDTSLRQKYIQRGWSEAKIARALAPSKSHVRRHEHWNGLRADVVERLVKLCDTAGSLAIYVHFYNEDIETGRVPVELRSKCTCAELPTRSAKLKENELLLVKSEPSANRGELR